MSGVKRRNFFVVPSAFLALQVQLVVLASAFTMVSTAGSVSCLLFFYSRCFSCSVICKSGGEGTCPPCPMESVPVNISDIAWDVNDVILSIIVLPPPCWEVCYVAAV